MHMIPCFYSGYLVDGTGVIPTDVAERETEFLPTIGCSRLRCRNCGAQVRHVVGVAFATKEDIEPSALATLYDMPDLLMSPLMHRTRDEWRLYICRCDRWLETDKTALDPPDRDDSPGKPWYCEGHPLMALPYTYAGASIETVTDLRTVTQCGLSGEVQPVVRAADREKLYWLLRLHGQLEPDVALAMTNVAAVNLQENNAATLARSLWFLFYTATEQHRERVLDVLKTKQELLTAPIEFGVTTLDNTVSNTAWRVVAPLVAQEGAAREYARSEALANRPSRALFDALAQYDTDWFLTHLEEIVQSIPGNAGVLIDSLIRLPYERRSIKNAQRIRDLLIGKEVVLDELTNTMKAFASMLQKTALKDLHYPVTQSLTLLRDGTELALEVNPPAVAQGDELLLTLNITRAHSTVITTLIKQDKKLHLVILLGSKNMVERILYKSLIALPMPLGPLLVRPGSEAPTGEASSDRASNS